MAAKEKILNNSEGQAIFELIVFLPFLVYFVTILFTAGSAINGSINQQKATRGYFYYIVKGNSNLPVASDLNALSGSGIASVSVASIGWAEKKTEGGEENYGTCYEFSRLYSSSEETCDTKRTETDKSIFIKPLTFYGVCSATYSLQPDGEYLLDYRNSANMRCSLPGS